MLWRAWALIIFNKAPNSLDWYALLNRMLLPQRSGLRINGGVPYPVIRHLMNERAVKRASGRRAGARHGPSDEKAGLACRKMHS